MELYFLGTGAGSPTLERNVSSIALRLHEERGTFWLFDCGEGTQHRILHSPLKLSRLEKLFVTHLHGDHIFGIPGLISSRSNQGVTAPLTIYGPPGIREFLNAAMRLSGSHVQFELHIEEIHEGTVFSDHQFAVETALLEHRIDSYGYRIVEHDSPGRLLSEKLVGLGVPPGPLYARLKHGEDVVLADGRQLISSDFVEPDLPGRIVAILGDTRLCAAAKKLARNADVLVHEATFTSDLQQLAFQYYHSTAAQAAQTARDSGAEMLVMTHLSSRYKQDGQRQLLEEARQIWANSQLASDFACFPIHRRSSSI